MGYENDYWKEKEYSFIWPREVRDLPPYFPE